MSDNLILNGRYELLREYNRGGMSIVHLAQDIALDGKIWAVKQVRQNTGVDLSAFRREIEMLSQLNHSDIPRIVDRIEYNGSYYVVMDFIDGVSMRRKIERDGPQSEEFIVAWAKQLCGILKYLHTVNQQPIIYLDLKPENVILVESGGVGALKLIDFGVAKVVPHGTVSEDASFGTRGYAAPEQYANGSKRFDERTDIYALGATLYFMATGEVPDVPPKAIGSIREKNRSYSEGLDYIIQKCSKDNPKERYNNCDEVLEDLNRIAQFTTSYRDEMRKRIATFVLLILVSLLGLGVFFFGDIMNDRQLETDALTAKQIGLSYESQAYTYEKQYIYDAADEARDKAVNAYLEAIEKNSEDVDVYLHLFSVLLPRNDDTDYQIKTQVAIDTLRTYVEKPSSPMYYRTEIIYQLAKKCIDISGSAPVYAQYAIDYLNRIMESDEYKNELYNHYEIESLKIIAESIATDVYNISGTNLAEALQSLESILDNPSISASNKLDTYYTMMNIYSRYADYIPNSYQSIIALGEKAKAIIDLQLESESESFTFNAILPMYEMIAMSCYESAIVNTEDYYARVESFRSSIEWFNYLEELSIGLTDDAKMKKANAWRGIYETYYNYDLTGDPEEYVKIPLENAAELYLELLEADSSNMTAKINLTFVRLYEYLNCSQIGIDRSTARNRLDALYQETEQMVKTQTDLTSYNISRFNALRKLYETLVIGG